MRSFVNELHVAQHKMSHLAHKAEHPAHFVYFALVFASSHSYYGYAAAACAFLILLAHEPE